MEDKLDKLEDQAGQLLGTLEIHVKCCEVLIDYINKVAAKLDPSKFSLFLFSEIGHYFIALSNIHFSESVSILTTLLHNKQNKEISLNKLKSRLNIESQTELNSIREEFNNSGFLKFRHTEGDHKNQEHIVNPVMLTMEFRDYDFPVLNNIFLRLQKWAHSNFNLTTHSPVQRTVNGLKKMLSQIHSIPN